MTALRCLAAWGAVSFGALVMWELARLIGRLRGAMEQRREPKHDAEAHE